MVIISSKHLLGLQAHAACKETLTELADFLPQRFPDMFQKAGSRMTNLLTGKSWDLDNLHEPPLEVCSQLVQVPTVACEMTCDIAPETLSLFSKMK